MATDEQRTLVRDKLGGHLRDIYGGRGPLAGSARLDQLPGWPELDLADVIFVLRREFRFKASDDEWRQFLAPDSEPPTDRCILNDTSHITVDAITNFICDRLPPEYPRKTVADASQMATLDASQLAHRACREPPFL